MRLIVAPKRIAALVFLAALAVSGKLAADPREGHGDALEMAADRLELDVEAKSARLTGNVHLRIPQRAMAVSCPLVEVRYDQVPHVTWLRGSGGVTAELQGIKAQAPEVELDIPRGMLELRGGVRLTRGEGWLTAERASIQIATGKVALTDVKGSLPLPRPPPSP
jgi:lipopolysaccharide export system protein LptA